MYDPVLFRSVMSYEMHLYWGHRSDGLVLSLGQTRTRIDASWQTRVCMDLQDCSVKREQELHASR